MDKSGANKAAMDEINGRGETPIIERPSQLPEQHRPAGPLGHQTDHQIDAQLHVIAGRQKWLAGIELMHMIRKGQLLRQDCIKLSFADRFYALAGQIRPV